MPSTSAQPAAAGGSTPSPARAVVAVDAMGGDSAPGPQVRGALEAVDAMPCNVALVGRPELLTAELAAAGALPRVSEGRVTVVAASEVVGMDEHPAAAVRGKPDSSIVRACELVASGEAAAAVSAGNSGATLAAALLRIRRLPGVARPAIGTVLPSAHGGTYVLDVGANADCRAEWLAQFAVMGSVYAQMMMGVTDPRVGLLSNGEEPGKGSSLVQAATPLLEASGVRFVGNIEGRDLFRSACDVAVTDGFTGNVALKTAEGVAELLFAAVRDAARSTARARLGGLLVRPALRAVRDRADYRRTGGALLLGIAGEVVIAHGRSDAVAIMSAIGVALTAAGHTMSAAVGRRVASSPAGDAGESPAATTSSAS